jgi:uncharacterized protein
MKRFFTLVFFLISTMGIALAQTDVEYKAALRKMFEASGQRETFKATIPQIITMFKQQKSGVPDAIWDEFAKEAESSIDEIFDMLTPVYEKHLTLADVKKITEFYQSPSGKKLAEKTPLITQESMAVGQQWGMKLGQKLMQKLQSNGY